MRELKVQGMQQLIIDLRDNGGGLVSHAYRIADAFLSEGQVVFTQKGRIEVSAIVMPPATGHQIGPRSSYLSTETPRQPPRYSPEQCRTTIAL